jgi:predicted SAM-dependent methyltransferase
MEMAEVLRINLGCGSTYKPGYINIDRFDGSVADMLADVSSLPYESNSIDVIEAAQLIEHFDLAHLRYVLAEWFRVLKPGAELVLETPDLSRSFKKLLRSKNEQRKTTLQWIFGIDSPGLQHKSGFTFAHLKQELELTGFCEIVREKELTHTYEPGMRVKCRKQSNPEEKMFFACFRKRLRNIRGMQDSFILIPLENWIEKARSAPSAIASKNRLHELISSLAPCNPIVPLALLDEAVASNMLSEPEVLEERAFLRELVDMRFHERAFELWTRSKKGLEVDREFASFISRVESLVRDSLKNPGLRKERLAYIQNLDPRPIALFDLSIVLQEAQKSFSAGVKAFSMKDLAEAEKRLTESLSINPRNPLAYWNLARVSAISGRSPEMVSRHYCKTVDLMLDVGLRKKVKSELHRFSEGNADIGEMTPISEL